MSIGRENHRRVEEEWSYFPIRRPEYWSIEAAVIQEIPPHKTMPTTPK